MDMHTDTTTHLAAEGAEMPTRAHAVMSEALGIDEATLREWSTRFAEFMLTADQMDDAALEAFEAGLAKLCPRHAEPAALAIWEKVAHDLEQTSLVCDLDMSCGAIADCEYEAGEAFRAAVKASRPDARVVDQYLAQIAIERLARFAAESGIYLGCADRPTKMVAVAQRIAAIQELSRSFSEGDDSFAPWLFSAAVKVVFDDVWAIDSLPRQRPALLAAE